MVKAKIFTLEGARSLLARAALTIPPQVILNQLHQLTEKCTLYPIKY